MPYVVLKLSRKKEILTFCLLLGMTNLYCQTRHTVPGDFPTIQEAADAAVDGDSVVVMPGTYYGVVDFKGKEILVTSLFRLTGDTSYISNTIISPLAGSDLGKDHRAAWFRNSESHKSELSGFTIKDFFSSCCGDGFIDIVDASPTLSYLKLINNKGPGAKTVTITQTNQKEPVRLESVEISNCEGSINATNANVSLVNCLITASRPVTQQGGTLTILNSLINDGREGAGVSFYGDKIVVLNSVLRTEYENNGIAHFGLEVTADSLLVRNSFIDSIHFNVAVPTVIDTAGFKSYNENLFYANGYRPSRFSPFIDKGAPSFSWFNENYHAPSKDIDGFDREWKAGDIIDLGPYEYRSDDNTIYEPPTISLLSSKNPFCEGDIIEVSATPSTYGEYFWSRNGMNYDTTTTAKISVAAEGRYRVLVYDEIGAPATSEISVSFFPEDTNNPNNGISYVTADGSGNRIYLNPSIELPIKNWIIYKETSIAGQMIALDTIPYAEEGASYFDESSNPDESSSTYSVRIQNICDKTSSYGILHKTLHLAANEGINGEINLFWQPYSGLDFSTYKIYRGRSLNELELLTERAASATLFTDTDPPAGPKYYAVAISLNSDCSAIGRRNNEPLIFSNILKKDITTEVEDIIAPGGLSVYPMPAKTSFIISASQKIYAIEILDIVGNKVKSIQFPQPNENIEVYRSDIPAGVYFLQVSGRFSKVFRKVIFE